MLFDGCLISTSKVTKMQRTEKAEVSAAFLQEGEYCTILINLAVTRHTSGWFGQNWSQVTGHSPFWLVSKCGLQIGSKRCSIYQKDTTRAHRLNHTTYSKAYSSSESLLCHQKHPVPSRQQALGGSSILQCQAHVDREWT